MALDIIGLIMPIIKTNENIMAALDVVAWCEGTKGKGDDGYNVLVSPDGADHFFSDYHHHPHVKVVLSGSGIKSDAAGRYQIMSYWWDQYQKMLGLPDFSPLSQDKYAINLFKETKAYNYFVSGDPKTGFTKCRSRWASLPGAGYDQPEKTMDECLAKFKEFGGIINA